MEMIYNFHIIENCNYKCKFCFAKWKEACELPEIYNIRKLMKKLFKNLSKKNIAGKAIGENITGVRINFAGGEPLMLGKNFEKIVGMAKIFGFETSLITNGYLLERHPEIFKYLDMIGISVDSLDEKTCRQMGRYSGNSYLSKEKLDRIVHEIRVNNPKAKLKFNTVVSEYNYDDAKIIGQLQAYEPDRLKVLRQLPFNEQKGITNEQFNRFLESNKNFLAPENVVIEDENDIIQSYLMIDPQGRFFQNGEGRSYSYSRPIYEVGLKQALSEINFDKNKFMSRYTQGGASND
jgi:radical S-adenosyl methionine domain-containing protein 2